MTATDQPQGAMIATDSATQRAIGRPVISAPGVALCTVFSILLLVWGGTALDRRLGDRLLAPNTVQVLGQLADGRVHCLTFDDADHCIQPARARALPKKVLWLGNSQLHDINQFENGNRPASELFAEALRPHGADGLTFSQSNGNLGEHLVLFEALLSPFEAQVLIIPLVFDDMRETGLRREIARALQDPSIRTRLEASAAGRSVAQSHPYSDRTAQFAGSEGLQSRFEALILSALDTCCDMGGLQDDYQELIAIRLYQARNTIFGIKPSSVRRKIPGAYDANIAALKQILARARELGIKVITYIAPLRSDAPRPYDPAEYRAFKDETRRIAEAAGARHLDLEDLVPNVLWGSKDATSFDGTPEIDFMHFQAGGHDLLAQRIGAAVLEVLK